MLQNYAFIKMVLPYHYNTNYLEIRHAQPELLSNLLLSVVINNLYTITYLEFNHKIVTCVNWTLKQNLYTHCV